MTTAAVVSPAIPWPYVRYFQIASQIVEDSINALVEQSGKERNEICNAIREQIAWCIKEWYSNKTPNINYSNPLCRLAYLYVVVPSTASVIESILRQDEELTGYIDLKAEEKASLSICGFGGGPGSELLGICKWIESRKLGEPIALDYLLLDRVNEWLDSWKAIRKQIENRFTKNIGKSRGTWPLTISGNFSAVDISNLAGIGNLGAIFDQDLFIMSYVISEIFANFQSFRDFTQKVAAGAPSGAKFLFIDRNGACWKQEVQSVAEAASISLSDFHENRGSVTCDTESTSDVSQLWTDIGSGPKLTWNAFWVVGTKK